MSLDTVVIIWLAGALFGSMLFFALSVAPAVSRTLSAENSGLFLQKLFPWHYLRGLVIALLGAAIAMSTTIAVSVALLLVALLFVFERQALMPLTNHARDQELQGTAGAGRRFKYLHFQASSLMACNYCCYWLSLACLSEQPATGIEPVNV